MSGMPSAMAVLRDDEDAKDWAALIKRLAKTIRDRPDKVQGAVKNNYKEKLSDSHAVTV